MKTNIVLAIALLIFLNPSGFAQEDREEVKTWRQMHEEYIQKKRREEEKWRQDFRTRMKKAHQSYEEQGLSPEEIKGEMAKFKEEAQEYIQSEEAERQEHKEKIREARTEEILFEKMDTNNDGKVDGVEEEAWQEYLALFDTNKDGIIDEREKKHALKSYDIIDQNRDGLIDDAERKAWQELKKRRLDANKEEKAEVLQVFKGKIEQIRKIEETEENEVIIILEKEQTVVVTASPKTEIILEDETRGDIHHLKNADLIEANCNITLEKGRFPARLIRIIRSKPKP